MKLGKQKKQDEAAQKELEALVKKIEHLKPTLQDSHPELYNRIWDSRIVQYMRYEE